MIYKEDFNMYNHLYFANQQYDISKVQTTVGITVTIGEYQVLWANTTGDLGGEPETLDCTPLSASVQMNKAGVISLDNWNVDYFFNDGDFGQLNTYLKDGGIKDIAITLPNGTKFTNKGKCTANTVTGIAVNGLINGHAVFELSQPDGWTYVPAPSSSGLNENA